ncbi:MAG: class I SAM-dependent methyltransferase [Gemella sp.]|nr:class I SAM-dependent methyltransferase [Gemella sp.]
MSKIEELFHNIDKKVEELYKEEDSNYLTALAKYLSLEDDQDYFSIVDGYSKEEIRKTYQFLLLKAIKELGDVNYGMTPEVIAFYMSSLAKAVLKDKKADVTDLASGSGNIILSLMNQLEKESTYTSVEIDSDYVLLQSNMYNLLEEEVTIYRQDALKDINIPLQDLVVADVPYAYYVDDNNAMNYKLCASEGHSLNSFLFLEQATRYLKEDGLAVLLMPKEIMNLDEKIKKFIAEEINFNAFITLPEEMFKNSKQEKVILIASKKNNKVLPRQVFLGHISSFQSKSAYTNLLDSFNEWLESK